MVLILERPSLLLLLMNKDKLSSSQKHVPSFPANKQALAVPVGRPSPLRQEPAGPGDGRQLLQRGRPGLSTRPGCHLPTPPAKKKKFWKPLPALTPSPSPAGPPRAAWLGARSLGDHSEHPPCTQHPPPQLRGDCSLHVLSPQQVKQVTAKSN